MKICELCSSKMSPGNKIISSDIIALWSKLGISVERLFQVESLQKFTCINCSLGCYSPFIGGDDKFYGDLSKLRWYYEHSGKTEFIFSSKYIKPGMKVLDVGCGIGEFSLYLTPEVDYLGVEFSTKSVQKAKALGRKVEQLDITKSNQNLINAFDVIVCFQVLEHISDLKPFLLSLKQLCKLGGKIIIATPNNDGFISRAINNILNLPPHHLLFWNKKSLTCIAKIYNLSIIEYFEEPLSLIHAAWHRSVGINQFINDLFGREEKVLDLSLVGRGINISAKIISKIISIFSSNSVASGHTSIIVFQKIDG